MSDILDDDIKEALRIAEEVMSQHEEENGNNKIDNVKIDDVRADNNEIDNVKSNDNKINNIKNNNGKTNSVKIDKGKTDIQVENEKPRNVPKKLRDPWSLKKKIIVTLIILFVLFVIAPVTILFVLCSQGQKSLELEYTGSTMGLPTDEDGNIMYNGHAYAYNSDIITILCLAVDNEGFADRENSARSPDTVYDEDGNMIVREEQDDSDILFSKTDDSTEIVSDDEELDNRNRDDEISYTDGEGTNYKINTAQIDMAFLLVINKASGKTNIIQINRDTMTDVDIQDVDGNSLLSGNMQLTLAYAYGDGAEISINNTENTVSNMLYNIPIHGYILMDINTVSDLNDAINGVTLIPTETVCEDVYANTSVTLNGNQAVQYVEYMDVVSAGVGNNSLRIARQKQYITAWYRRFKQKKDTGSTDGIKKIYNIFKNDMNTDVDLKEQIYLYSILKNSEVEVDNIEELPGEYTRTYHFDEYSLDEDQLQDMIIKYFYKEVD
jgi:anionic cell wall polymer biosynthesis LytR-Cps2A-Psr (LCP) family protein